MVVPSRRVHRFLPLMFALVACDPTLVARCEEPLGMCDQPASPVGAMTLRQVRERTPRLAEGAPLDVRAVTVTAIDAYDETRTGRTGTIWAQEITPVGASTDRFAPCPLLPDGSGRVCALSMFSPSFAPSGYRPGVGDLVDIVGGGYAEFTCATCGSAFPDANFLPQASYATLRRVGVAPPHAPVPVTLDELNAHYRELMGVLVTVEDVTASTDPDPRFGELTLSGALSLAPQLTPLPGARRGTHWDRVTGVVTYFYNPKLLPRTLADLVGQRDPA